ncbi:MAG: efflux RND transporter periplasmic adaptor subunit [Chloroflexota bacterium]
MRTEKACPNLPAHSFRPIMWKYSTHLIRRAIIICLLLGVLTACNFPSGGSGEAEEPPVELETYQPTNLNESAEGESQSSVASTNTASNVEETNATAGQSSSETPAVQSDAPDTIQLITRGAYNGEIEADETVTIVPEIPAKVIEINVEEGDKVVVGELLVRLDSSLLDGQQAQSVAGLKGAKAQLDLLFTLVDDDNVQAAQASVNAAATAYQEALNGPSAEDIQIVESQVRQAEAAVRTAQAAYNEVKGNPRIAMMPQSMQLEQATLALEAVQAQYQKVLDGTPVETIAGAYAQLVQAQSQLKNLQEGAKEEQILAAEAQVEMAEAALYLSTLQLSKASIPAPMDGIVISKNATRGSMASPGVPLLVLMSTDVNVTIPVEESRMAQLAVGQPAVIRVNAYPERVFAGEIIRIAPQLEASTRTVKVTIRPTDDDEKLLAPGMFATVDLVE